MREALHNNFVYWRNNRKDITLAEFRELSGITESRKPDGTISLILNPLNI